MDNWTEFLDSAHEYQSNVTRLSDELGISFSDALAMMFMMLMQAHNNHARRLDEPMKNLIDEQLRVIRGDGDWKA